MENFTYLPIEILLQICKYLSTYDLIQLVEVFPQLSYFFEEKSIISKISFDKCFEAHTIDLYNFLRKSINSQFVTTLNLNGIYWINGADLMKILKSMPNLVNLYALDTDLYTSKSYRPDDKDISHIHSNLQSLAVNFYNENRHFWQNLCLPYVRRIVIKNFIGSDKSVTLIKTIKSWISVEEVWFIDSVVPYSNCYSPFYLLPNLKRINFISKCFCKGAHDFNGLTEYALVYSNQQSGYHEYTYVKRDILRENYKDQLPKPDYWNVFDSLHFGFPCGYEDAINLACRNDINFMTFQYRDINYNNNTSNIYHPRLNAAFKELLLSQNCQHLKGLCITTLNFLETNDEGNENVTTEQNEFKSKRVGVQAKSTHHFLKIAQNMPDLEELEIWNNESLVTFKLTDIMSGFSFIHCFKKLKQLTLEIPCGLDGSFLKEVFSNCPLISLRISSKTYNDKLSFALCSNLHNCTALRDLRLKLINLDVDKFFTCLSKLSYLKRLYMDVDNVEKFSVNPLEQFLQNNLFLIFFYITIQKYPQTAMRNVEETLRDFKKKNSAKIFIARKDLNSFTGSFPIPYAHQDMIQFHSKVGCISYDEFRI